ncbi:MAG TPA: hypothetical protein VGI65_00245 [Steroidobacteraceae bacterium]
MTKQKLPAVAIFDNYWATTLAFVRSLGEQGVPLHVYGKGAGRWSRYCTARRSCPPIDDAQQFLPWLRERVRCGEITRVAPTTDLIAFYVSMIREEFSTEVQRSIAPLNEIENCLIKTRFSQLCAVSGQSALETVAPDDVDGAVSMAGSLGYPLLLKPKSHLVVGFIQRGRLVKNAQQLRGRFRQYSVVAGQEELAQSYPELRRPMLQRYIPPTRGRVFSISGVKDADGGVLTACLSYKLVQWPAHVGVSMVQMACEDQKILDAGLQVVDQLLSRGIFELELLVDGEHMYAIDLNPRAFGFMELDLARGANLPWLWFRTTLERVLPLAQQPSGASMAADLRFLPFLGGFSLRRAKPRASISMLGRWSDPLPKIIAHLYLLRHPRSVVRSQLAATRALRKASPFALSAQPEGVSL